MRRECTRRELNVSVISCQPSVVSDQPFIVEHRLAFSDEADNDNANLSRRAEDTIYTCGGPDLLVVRSPIG